MRPLRRVAVLIDRERQVEGDHELRGEGALRHCAIEFHLATTFRRLGYEVYDVWQEDAYATALNAMIRNAARRGG
jgi:hypothetical protein